MKQDMDDGEPGRSQNRTRSLLVELGSRTYDNDGGGLGNFGGHGARLATAETTVSRALFGWEGRMER